MGKKKGEKDQYDRTEADQQRASAATAGEDRRQAAVEAATQAAAEAETEAATEATAEAATQASTQAPATSAEELEELERQLEEKEERCQALVAQWQRLQADFDNFRKRVRREQEELRQYAAADLVEKLLPVLDNFGRALAETQKQAVGPEIDRSFRAGVEMIYRQLNGILEAAGLKRMEAVGQPFDPRCHDGLAREDQEIPPGATTIDVVVEEYETGYWFKDRVLRPARVKVASRVFEPEPEGLAPGSEPMPEREDKPGQEPDA